MKRRKAEVERGSRRDKWNTKLYATCISGSSSIRGPKKFKKGPRQEKIKVRLITKKQKGIFVDLFSRRWDC
jgi:hypothetical protein